MPASSRPPTNTPTLNALPAPRRQHLKTVTYSEAIDWLYELRLLGSKLGLDNPRQLAAHAGNPHERLRFIHVAGTNGKGSVCAMLESICREAGLKTGLYTSPHLLSFRERIQVNRRPVSQAEIVRLTECLQALLKKFPADRLPTFFEVVTVMALEHFAREEVDIVLWETGLGGRLDATNIVTPLASVITPIDLDHQQYLGETLKQIAAEKAGIIKPGIPVFSARQEPTALSVLESHALQTGARMSVASDEANTRLSGRHQRQNAALAKLVAREVLNEIPANVIETGLAKVQWAARAQCFQLGEQQVVIDAAHNPASAEAFADVLQEKYADQRPTLLLGMLADKNWDSIVATLAPLANRVVCVPVNSERSLKSDQLATAARAHCAAVECTGSVGAGLESVKQDPLVAVTGSLYLIGEVMESLNLAGAVDEPNLNEWKM